MIMLCFGLKRNNFRVKYSSVPVGHPRREPRPPQHNKPDQGKLLPPGIEETRRQPDLSGYQTHPLHTTTLYQYLEEKKCVL